MAGRSVRGRQGKLRSVAAAADEVRGHDDTPAGHLATVRESDAPRRGGLLYDLYAQHLSLELDNSKGSVARDHLANERTYLAWLRTSLSFASAGVGITQLLRLNTRDDRNRQKETIGRLRKLGKPAGAIMVVLALVVVIFGTSRYFRVQAAMQKGKFPASRVLVAFLSIATFLILCAGFAILIVFNPAGVPA